MKTITIFTLLFITINCRGDVYMCHDDPFKDEQCMKQETLGSNNFVWVRKCKGAKVCVTLPYYSYTIGACSIKVRSHYDGESCANGNKCTSGICDGTKCKGLNPHLHCERGLGQCKKGYLCRSSAKADGTATGNYTCEEAIDKDKECIPYSTSLSLTSSYYWLYDPSIFNPAYNPCKLGYVCATKNSNGRYLCTEIKSLDNGAEVINPMACKTGFATEDTTTTPVVYKCATPTDGTAVGRTAKGVSFTKLSNITKAFEEWHSEWKKKKIDEEDAIYEAYRYTKNKKKINELFYRYVYAPFVQDADECAYDYMWKRNSSNSLKLSLIILVLALLF